ncbi:MAG: TraB/GumN family protein [Bacteroidetes bacterium]|nr:MAG: TraB/GumN family protein [Bacteroidota bacterium]
MKQIAIACIALFLFVTAFAQNKNTLLWKVEGNGLTEPSYLYGTLHLVCPQDLVIDSAIARAFAKTNALFLEVKLDDPAVMLTFQKAMMVTDKQNWHSLLDSTKLATLSANFKQVAKFEFSNTKALKPFAVASILLPGLLGCTPASWEQEFMKLAKQKKKEVIGLETAERQAEALNYLTIPQQAEMVQEMLLNVDSSRHEFQKLIQLYKTKNLEGLYKLMNTNDKKYANFELELLIKRNQEWIPVIAAAAKKQPSFFAFGAGHLGGEQGVIQLLQKQGYIVTPINY